MKLFLEIPLNRCLAYLDIEPIKYWRELEKWIDIKSGVYSGAS